MRKIVIALLMCLLHLSVYSQDIAGSLIEKAIKKGFVLLRQDYQLLNEDDEPIDNKSGVDCYGRTYTCGVRVESDQFLVTKDFVSPWTGESIVISERRHPEISYTGFMELSTIDFEQIDFEVEDAMDAVENHIYSVAASEVEGFSIDDVAGRKKGYAVWLKSANAFSLSKAPTGLSLEIVTFNITTKETEFVYDVPNQPKGNVIGGAFLVPSINSVGKILLKVNGVFEKRGGVWKLISLGTEESDD